MSTSDIIEIEQLLYRYCFVLDNGNPEDVAALFSETAVLMPLYSGEEPAKGRAAILQWYQTYQNNTRAATDHLRHIVTNPVIDVEGDRAKAKCYLTANSISKSTGRVHGSAGVYEDKLVREGGRWLFAERQIHVFYGTESDMR
jgi:ketosteroid isomerase-like protein